MSRRRLKKSRVQHNRPQGMMEYFFVDGDPSKPRSEIVTKGELWGVLEWYHEQVIQQNTWRRRLWRALRRWPSTRIDPFAMIRVVRARIARERRGGVK